MFGLGVDPGWLTPDGAREREDRIESPVEEGIDAEVRVKQQETDRYRGRRSTCWM